MWETVLTRSDFDLDIIAGRYMKVFFCYSFNNSLASNYIWKCPEPSRMPGSWKAFSKYHVWTHWEIPYTLRYRDYSEDKEFSDGRRENTQSWSKEALLFCPNPYHPVAFTEWVKLSATMSLSAKQRLPGHLLLKQTNSTVQLQTTVWHCVTIFSFES